jgi:hypothetical protein
MYVLNNSLKKNPCTPPSGMVWSMMTILSIAQSFLDGSFSSSNSTEILMRRNFSLIGCNCEELSCKRTAGRTHGPILECTHFLSTQKVSAQFLRKHGGPTLIVDSNEKLKQSTLRLENLNFTPQISLKRRHIREV